MIQLFADDQLIYDNRLDGYRLLALTTTTGLNKSGTATFTMPPGHPGYNAIVSHKTVVTLYDGGELHFRGRALYPSDDFYNRRTVTCEGERGFFRDVIARPYSFSGSPEELLAKILALYNAQADAFKRFSLGNVTVTSKSAVRLEKDQAEPCSALLDALVESCGGYITFSDDGNGGRAINWLAEVGTRSSQPIEFGVNLLEFSRSGQSDELATVILPYGAQLDNGKRVTIASVTADGKDYIQDDTAVALRGFIMATVTWDDVTTPQDLLDKAQEWLLEHRLAVTSMQLTAVDLAKLGRAMETYSPGDQVLVRSKPHQVEGYFQLTDRTIDWLDPAGGKVTLGKETASLTGSDVLLQQSMGHMKVEIINTAKINAGAAVKEAEQRLSSKIEQLASSIVLEVSGSMGGTANITLSVDGVKTAQTLDLSEVRKAFADDTSSVAISAGTISFNSNSLIINSSNFVLDALGNITATGGKIANWNIDNNSLYAGESFKTATAFLCTGSNTSLTIAGHTANGWVLKAGSNFGVTSDGILYCTSGQLNGSITSELDDTGCKTELNFGALRYYIYDEICCEITAAASMNSNTRGATIMVGNTGRYPSFSIASWDPGSGLGVIHYAIQGKNPKNYYPGQQVFYTSVSFQDSVTLDVVYCGKPVYLCKGNFISACENNDSYTKIAELIGFSPSGFANSDYVNFVVVGSEDHNMLLRGSTVYLKNTSTTVTSDSRVKNSIEVLPEQYETFVDNLSPVRFKFNEGTSGRYHVGYIAQDVEAALTAAGLTTQDFAGYVDVGFSGELGLAYDEFIAALHLKIKKLESRINVLEKGSVAT